MPITGKEVVIPEQRYSQYWLASLTIAAPTSDGPQKLTAILMPCSVDGDVTTLANKRIPLKIDDLQAYAIDHPEVASAIATVLTALQHAAADLGVI